MSEPAYRQFQSRLHIIKEIHRRKVIERTPEGKPVEKKTKEPILCAICGGEFMQVFPNEKNCPVCKPRKNPPWIAKKAKEWKPILKQQFKKKSFEKEEVSKLLDFKYPIWEIRRVLYYLVKEGQLREITEAKACIAKRYTFETQVLNN